MHYSGEPDESSQILWLNVVFLFATPLLALTLGPYYVARHGIHWTEIAGFLGLWYLTGMGITAGYHRMFAHRAWWASKPVRAVMLVLGAATYQNSAIQWCSNHRAHHRHADTEDDPHSIEEGFWWAHMLWILIDEDSDDDHSNAPDLTDDPLCQWQHRHYFLIGTAFNIAVPAALGLLTGRVWGMLLWAGLIRVVVLHHLTFFINSLAHMWGDQPWTEEETARDNGVLAFLTLGEGYHNFHHAFPGDYRNGFRWYQFDPTKWTIWTLHKLGLAEDLRRSAIDERLRSRWQRIKSRYDSQMDEWNEQVRQRVESAEQQLDEALQDMRSKRHEWSRKASDLQDDAREEVRQARIEAERRAVEAFRAWRGELPQTVRS
jgi:stearoyl-CoA desaturase (delta-9 desaturase)